MRQWKEHVNPPSSHGTSVGLDPMGVPQLAWSSLAASSSKCLPVSAMDKVKGSSVTNGDKSPPPKRDCQIGHEAQVKLAKQIAAPRILVNLNGDQKMWIDQPDGGGRVYTSLNELEKSFSSLSDVGRYLEAGGAHSVPVRIYIKAKHKMVSVETEGKLKEVLTNLYKELIAKGHTAEDATKRIFKEPQFHKYSGYRGAKAELIVKTAMDEVIKNFPSLSISSVFKLHVWRPCEKLLTISGITVTDPEKNDEYDIQIIYVHGDGLGFIFIEVKNGSQLPWMTEVSPPRASMFEGKGKKLGSWGQLGKSYKFLSELFSDIPFARVHYFTAIPNMPKHVLEQQVDSCCLPKILCKDDIEDLSVLSERLELDTVLPATECGKKQLGKAGNRVVGQASKLHRMFREPSQVKPSEEKQLNQEVEQVDKNIWMVFDSAQERAFQEAKRKGAKVTVIEGAPGTGKTILGLKIMQFMAEEARKKMGEDPTLILTSGFNGSLVQDAPLRQFMERNADGGQVIQWGMLLQKYGVKRVIDTATFSVFNIQQEIAELGQAMTGQMRKVILLMDEADASEAPKDQTFYDWTALSKIPEVLTIVLIVNPGTYYGFDLLLPPTCLRLALSTTYRSTQSIHNFHACISAARNLNAPAGEPGTEVVGELPRLMALGHLGTDAEADGKMKHGLQAMRSEIGEGDVRVIFDDYNLTANMEKLVTKETGPWGWTVMRGYKMRGAEADRVIVIGQPSLETISRARFSLGILLCCHADGGKMYYNNCNVGLRAAADKGRVLVATPPWHPQVTIMTKLPVEF